LFFLGRIQFCETYRRMTTQSESFLIPVSPFFTRCYEIFRCNVIIELLVLALCDLL